jgi:hypothetical protein
MTAENHRRVTRDGVMADFGISFLFDNSLEINIARVGNRWRMSVTDSFSDETDEAVMSSIGEVIDALRKTEDNNGNTAYWTFRKVLKRKRSTKAKELLKQIDEHQEKEHARQKAELEKRYEGNRYPEFHELSPSPDEIPLSRSELIRRLTIWMELRDWLESPMARTMFRGDADSGGKQRTLYNTLKTILNKVDLKVFLESLSDEGGEGAIREWLLKEKASEPPPLTKWGIPRDVVYRKLTESEN